MNKQRFSGPELSKQRSSRKHGFLVQLSGVSRALYESDWISHSAAVRTNTLLKTPVLPCPSTHFNRIWVSKAAFGTIIIMKYFKRQSRDGNWSSFVTKYATTDGQGGVRGFSSRPV